MRVVLLRFEFLTRRHETSYTKEILRVLRISITAVCSKTLNEHNAFLKVAKSSLVEVYQHNGGKKNLSGIKLNYYADGRARFL
jgi:N-dimethylarginine dimethylaminohydrolase